VLLCDPAVRLGGESVRQALHDPAQVAVAGGRSLPLVPAFAGQIRQRFEGVGAAELLGVRLSERGSRLQQVTHDRTAGALVALRRNRSDEADREAGHHERPGTPKIALGPVTLSLGVLSSGVSWDHCPVSAVEP
jgi:hypothetical protein